MKIARLRRALAAGAFVRDEDFDEVYPLVYRQASSLYWTPVETARRAATLLIAAGARRILDVGAGIGKFCIVAAALTSDAMFTGIEQRAHLVDVGLNARQVLGVSRAELLHAALSDFATASFDGFYFYNPFIENALPASFRLDDSVPLSPSRYKADVCRAARLLASARVGTPVVTYHGYGGKMPRGYELTRIEGHLGMLRLWVKTTATPTLGP